MNYEAYCDLKKDEIGPFMSEHIARMKRLLRNMGNPVDRWNYIIDETPDTSWGVKMCDTLIDYAAKLTGGIKRPRLDSSKLREMTDGIMQRVKPEAKIDSDKAKRKAHQDLDTINK